MPKRATRPPSKQGNHDGICGIYAVLNATKHVYPNMRNSTLAGVFRTSAMSIQSSWPSALWEGTSMSEVRTMLAATKKFVDKRHQKYEMIVREPFKTSAPATAEEYFARVRDLLQDGPSAVILGIGPPWDHWTVVRDVTNRSVWLLDSYGNDTLRIAETTLSRNRGKRVKIDQHQTFLVRRVQRGT